MNNFETSLDSLFETAVDWVRSSSDSDSTPSEKVRLKLYGLYKRSTQGKSDEFSSELSRWNIVANRKFMAWKECDSLSVDTAKLRYIETLAGLEGPTGTHFQNLLSMLFSQSQEEAPQTIKELKSPCQNGTSTRLEEKNWKNKPSFFERFTGLKPFLPRGHLDISYSDMFHVLFECFRSFMPFSEAPIRKTIRLEEMIAQSWGASVDSRVHVGLSVRSLFDLYLSCKSFPCGSEVIIVPPIGIEGMIDVLHYHDLTVIPVDIDDYDDDRGPKISVNIERLKQKITPRTVAVLIVHPFGLICTSDNDMISLRELCDTSLKDRSIELWEDCAECFSGGYIYHGSSYSDVQFFSFGTIKTSTSLGGGVCVLNHQKGNQNIAQVSDKMKRVHLSTYEQQTMMEYLSKVMKALILHIFSKHHSFMGILIALLSALHVNYDSIVTSAVKGFPMQTYANDTSSKESLNKVRARQLIRRLRKRPHFSLLSLLHRRIYRFDRTKLVVQKRIESCTRMKTLLSNQMSISLPFGHDHSRHLYWLFPFLTKDPNQISKRLYDLGFDIPRGTSQLGCVTSFLTDIDLDHKIKCPNAERMMSQILYLPVASIPLTDSEMIHMASILSEVHSSSTYEVSKRNVRSLSILVPICSILILLSKVAMFPIVSVLRYFIIILKFVAYMSIAILIGLYTLRKYLSAYYLRSSSAFAKYNSMLKDTRQMTNSEDDECSSYNQNFQLDDYDPLRLPKRLNDPNAQEVCHKVILTGATGFIGSLLLRDLLLHRETLGICGGVIVICRKRRNKSASERIMNILSKEMYSFLNESEKRNLVSVIEGDLSLPQLGMSDKDYADLCNQTNVTHVINSAACVNFMETLDRAAVSNITSALQLQALTRTLKGSRSRYVHISTAFVHGDKIGSHDDPLPESLFDFGMYNPEELYQSMMGTQSYASAAMHSLGFPNSYTFTKSVCEHILSKNKGVDTIIIRPSIVGPSVQQPFEGWAGDKPSTLVAAACLYLKNPFNLWHFGREKAPVIPVDVVSRFILHKSFDQNQIQSYLSDDSDESYCKDSYISGSSSEEEYDFSIHTAAWNHSSTVDSGFLWYDFACATVQLGCANGHVSYAASYFFILLCFKILPMLNLNLQAFKRMHKVLIHLPLTVISFICQSLGVYTPFRMSLNRLIPFLDLPVLFFPFTTSTFHFQSKLVAPRQLNAERYMFSCVLAAEHFVKYVGVSLATVNQIGDMNTVIAGRNSNTHRSDLIWSLMQPSGNIIIRFIGYVVMKILRRITTEVQVDLYSLSCAQNCIETLRLKQHLNRGESVCVIVAPTHRSFLDFILISYLAFILPETGLRLPAIAAAEEFSNIPIVGVLAKLAGAFFLKRGNGRVDVDLKKKISNITKCSKGDNPIYLEAFIEGTRSRDRRFGAPKTGLLRCLANNGGVNIILPVTINYERIPEQTTLSVEVCELRKRAFNLSSLTSWLRTVFSGGVHLGRIEISFSLPFLLNQQASSNMKLVTQNIQNLQKRNLMISSYHIRAAASCLDIECSTVCESLKHLDCKLWVDRNTSDGSMDLPSSKTELWSIFLQFAHLYAAYIKITHPGWAMWLDPDVTLTTDGGHESSDLNTVIDMLKSKFDSADRIVDETLAHLQEKGFEHPSPAHIMQYTLKNPTQPCELLIQAAITLKNDSGVIDAAEQKPTEFDSIGPIFNRSAIVGHKGTKSLNWNENFGAWGYADSGFIVDVQSNGSKTVCMKGDRYVICGRKMPKLIPFLEQESDILFDPRLVSLPLSSRVSTFPTQLSQRELHILRDLVSGESDRISTDDVDRIRHGTGHSQEDMFMIRSNAVSDRRMPDAVIYPKTELEVINIVASAQENNWCLIPFGGGTNVSHATWCPSRDVDPRPIISIDTRLLNAIISLNEEDCTVHVQAGITGGDLVRQMQALGYTIGHEPDSIEFSTVGGWIATKASGMKQNKYGNIEDIVLHVHIITSQGKLWQNDEDGTASFARLSTGTDLKSLVLGSEGSLGIITSAVLKCWPSPEKKEYDSVIFNSFDDGLRFAKDVSKLGRMKPASVRLLDNTQFRLGQSLSSADTVASLVRRKITGVIGAISGNRLNLHSMVCVTIAYEGSKSEVEVQRKNVSLLASKHGGLCAGSDIGKAGYDMTFAIAYIRDFAMTYGFIAESFETFVPWSKVQNLIKATKARLQREHSERALPGRPIITCRITQLYDQGVCVYFYFCMNYNNVKEPSAVLAAIEMAAREEILEQGGSLSHHHGIGKHRAKFMDKVNNSHLKIILSNFKAAMDPNNIFGVRNGSFS